MISSILPYVKTRQGPEAQKGDLTFPGLHSILVSGASLGILAAGSSASGMGQLGWVMEHWSQEAANNHSHPTPSLS